MNEASSPLIEQLLNASAKDEAVLQFAVPDEIFGFHVQQAIEKLLKALISARGETFAFTHDIESLEAKITALGEQIPHASYISAALTEYASRFRYAPGAKIEVDERESMRSDVVRLREFVLQRIGELRGQ